MEESFAKWRTPLLLLGATVVVIGGFVLFAGGRSTSTTPVASATESPSGTVAPLPPTQASPSATSATTASAPVVPPTAVASVAPSASGSTAIQGVIPPPPGEASVFVPPTPKEITPDWQSKKTQEALAVVQTRRDRTAKEIDDLEKSGKPQDAVEKKILLKRLDKQIADMKVEIAGYNAQAAASASVSPAGSAPPPP